MIPLIDLFEKVRLNKHFTKVQLRQHLDVTERVLQNIYSTKVIPRDLIPAWATFLELDVANAHSLTQYNERELLHREVTAIMYGRIKRDGLIEKLVHIMFFNIDIDLPINLYLSKLYPLPRQLDEIIIDRSTRD